jgi:hypothetical protein
MKRLLTIAALGGVLIIAGAPQNSSASLPPTNYGGGDSGYSQLPACVPAYYGVTLVVQGYRWKCINATLDHWVLS